MIAMVMKPSILFTLLSSAPLFLATSLSAAGSEKFLPLSKDLVAFDSAEGRSLFRGSAANEPFWQLAQFYVTQPDLGSCGVASSTMVLNALAINRPISASHGQFHLYTVDNFFTPKIEKIRPRSEVSKSGMSLEELAEILATHSVAVHREYAQPDGVARFRATVKLALQTPGKFVLINYLRKALGQESGGHISPLGAYHEDKDMVLILDVSNYKYPWAWAKLEQVYHAMSVKIADSGKPRGYLVLQAKP